MIAAIDDSPAGAATPLQEVRIHMRIASKAKNHLIIGILVTFLSLSLPTRVFALRGESDQLAQLLGEARNEAGELARDADETESLIRNDASWQTHAEMLESVKRHVNNMGRIIDKLTATRASGSELQEQAVDRILPLLKELAANTTAAINYLNQNKTRPIGEPYTQYLKENADTAHQLASTVSSLFEYEKTMNKMGELKNKLDQSGQ
jgi:predicted ArsR family transcriptional regulator